MDLIINGENKKFGDSVKNIELLLDSLSVKKEKSAVELNGKIIDQKIWRSSELKTGDKLEIVTFVGGG
ncbi:MAG: sulfur carrier protein ThiS [Candidatus Margulisiibacteriota bacterium]